MGPAVLWVTERMVKFHISSIYRKREVGNRTQASHYALVNGLMADRQPGRPALKIASSS